jgi:inosine-uridine nucleoside N-ribohydrolase
LKRAHNSGRLLWLIMALLAVSSAVAYIAGKYSLVGRVRFAIEQSIRAPEPADAPSIQDLTRRSIEPVRLIFDTDIGNDVDDVLALALLHELADRGEVELLAVTISKDNPWSAPHVDVINTFYGRPDVPIGVVQNGKTKDDGRFNRAVVEKVAGAQLVFPRSLLSGTDAPEAVGLLRRILADQPDGSVVLVTVGFLTNAAQLVESRPDSISTLTGVELVRSKVRLFVAMFGSFGSNAEKEYNASMDAQATRRVLALWPSPVVVSGFEIGRAILFPAASIERDFAYVDDHPVADSYRSFAAMPFDRPTWDLTAVLFAVRPDRGYFGLSGPGSIVLDGTDVTRFVAGAGSHRYLTLADNDVARLQELFVQMVSSPPRQ